MEEMDGCYQKRLEPSEYDSGRRNIENTRSKK